MLSFHPMSDSPLRILFCGTSAFAVPCLQILLGDSRFCVDAVVTQPDKPVGRKQVLTASPVKVAATEANIITLQPANLNQQRTLLDAFPRPDFLIVVSYGQILSEDILAIPAIAPINVHASLLPKYRGASPIQHTILNGETETGVSVQRMVKALDAGPVYVNQSVAIDPRETAMTLHDKLAAAAAPLLVKILLDLPVPVAQDESQVTVCGKLSRDDGIVDPSSATAAQIDTRVRALVPWPGVTWDGNKILETALESTKESMPLPCAKDSVLHIVSIQPTGGKPMTGAEFARGRSKKNR